MHRARSECFVFGALALVLRASRIVGAAPLRMTREHRGWRVSMSPAQRIYGYFVLFASHACLIAGVVTDGKLSPDKAVVAQRHTFRTTWMIELILTQVIATIGVFSASTKMKQMIEFMNIIEKIKVQSNCSFATDPAERKRYIAAVVCLALINFHHIGDFCWRLKHDLDNDKEILVTFLFAFFYIEFYIIILLEMQFICLALQINVALQFINDSLNELKSQAHLDCFRRKLGLKSHRSKLENSVLVGNFTSDNGNDNIENDSKELTVKNLTTDQIRQKIQRLHLSFGALCDIISQVNDIYGYILLCLVGSSFIQLIKAPYLIFDYIAFKKQSFRHPVVQVFYCCFHFLKLVLAVEPGHRAQQEVERTAHIVSQLLNRLPSAHDELALELNMFCKQIALTNVSYSPLGMFTLNRSLIIAVLGGVITYLVIVFQFIPLEKQ